MDQVANLNQSWTASIVQEFIENNLRFFCLGYGSRNTPLVLALSNHPLAETVEHFDERGIGFHALGYAKANHAPAAIVVTSGSAVANVFPAVMEAFESEIPLIVITADRPWELKCVGANQTTDQTKIFNNHTHWQADIPPADPLIATNSLRSIISQAVFRAKQMSGPVHLNIQFREPFHVQYPQQFHVKAEKNLSLEKRPTIQKLQKIDENKILDFTKEILSFEKGIIFVGTLPAGTSVQPILQFAKKIGWPIFADITSHIRSEGIADEVIPYYDLMLQSKKPEKNFLPEIVLHFGSKFVSKALAQWLKNFTLQAYVCMNKQWQQLDFYNAVTHFLPLDPSEFCHTVLDNFPIATRSSYSALWRNWSNKVSKSLHVIFEQESRLTEMQIPYLIQENMNEVAPIFFGNSMPIRYADSLFFPTKKIGQIFANRGVSGIDGNIATAIGIARAKCNQTYVVIGDLTFLHDVNSLALLSHLEYPLNIIIINNQGGGIFSFLPIANQPTAIFEKYFAGNHNHNLEKIVIGFGLEYYRPESKESFKDILQRSQTNGKSVVIEIQTTRMQSFDDHQILLQKLKKTEMKKTPFSLCYSSFMKEKN